MTGFKKLCLVLYALLACSFFANAGNIHWTVSSEQISAEPATWRLTFTGKIDEGYHSYPLSDEFSGPAIEFSELSGCSLEGGLKDLSVAVKEGDYLVVNDALVLTQDLRIDEGSEKAVVKGTCITVCCAGNSCFPPEYIDFEHCIAPSAAASSSVSETAGESVPFDWSLILQAILWGFAMILTPCVFPMIPMTVSFFLKSSSSASAGRFNAFMYGLFIIFLYTLPITVIILITWIAGGDAVTADIFNWLATHWLPNILFFIVFMVFAASFFGAFEITLPSSWVNKADGKSGKKGLVGVFFMALTLVLVSFSCTGPIVGTVLIQSTQGQFWMPIVTMFAFSVAFALPFTVFALFPSLLNKLKSGSWLSSVKVVLGFIEVALGFKFLSVADQTYHWGLLDREVYLAIWIVVFSMLGFYLLGKLRFPHEDKVEHISLLRLVSSIAVFAFVVYMIPGMFGAPLKALSGYLPPISTQDFVINRTAATAVNPTANGDTANPYGLKMPYGLKGYFKLEDAVAAARKSGKPVFVDVTGHGCVNCREMEARVWSDPEVLSLLSDRFEIVALYVDDKTKLREEDWVYASNGDVYKEVGRANAYIARERFGVNSQPNYILLDSEGRQIASPRGYNLDIEGFKEFLKQAL
ncbi:MAG: thioredoxin family protein [Candidatus Cryptobacteroides sp.]|nr:thioredoxin family protein [Candidatus Cryptobacteroides sp.]